MSICPILVGGENNVVSQCLGEACKWWLPFADDCAIPTIAGVLADSTICQNVWDEPPKEET